MILSPDTKEDAAQVIQERIADSKAIAVCGSQSRGYFPKDIDRLSSRKLNKIRFLEPADMVVGVEAGMLYSELEDILADKGMMLPVKSWDSDNTVGGMVACNSFGSQKLFSGALRDAIIGMEYINGKGEIVRSGGKVVKNVTGYDLAKMMLGSQGGYGFITSVNFKVMPTRVSPIFLSLNDSSVDWAEAILKAHAEKIPFDSLQVFKKSGEAWTLQIGISGNSLRKKRIQSDLSSCMAPLEEVPYENLFANTLAESKFHLNSRLTTEELLDEALLKELGALNADLVLNPYGAEIHIFSSGSAEEQRELFQTCIKKFSANGRYLILNKCDEDLRNDCQFISPWPSEYPLMKIIKEKIDPQNIFHSQFFQDMQ
ncbi:MAG: FAD-binding oxidoreductase [Lentisphaeria bacterium]|nr:FAD-binding oxidoreductase [Lentisphaeria bacterium]NQZ71082.1 FAD-binding oxidoreductase [Lentisphaeria bacterium]